MSKLAKAPGAAAFRSGVAGVVERPVYFVSDRPEAYEIAGEVGHDEAGEIGRLIAEHAGRRFPGIEFRVDSEWHSHQPGMERVAAYIEEHWQHWVEQARA